MKNNKTGLIIIIAVLVVLIAGAAVLYNYLGSKIDNENISDDTIVQSQQDDTKVNLAEDFTVFDKDSNAFKLSDFRGKPVVLNFWASWCGPCKMEMPDFDAAYNKYKNDIHFLMVNLTDGSRETAGSALSFIENSGYTFPVYYDTSMQAATAYDVYSIPVTYFIDKNGKIVARTSGAISENTLQKGIDSILKTN